MVHLLDLTQRHLAHRFSASAAHRFADTRMWATLDTGEPLLSDTATWMRASIDQLIPAGDSTLVIGEVTRIHRDATTASSPLLYHDGTYHRAAALTA